MTTQRTVVWLATLLVLGNVVVGIYFMTRSGGFSEPDETQKNSSADTAPVAPAAPAKSDTPGDAELGARQGSETSSPVHSYVRVPSFAERAVPQPMADFRVWTERFFAAKTPQDQAALLAEGEGLARKRRETMGEIIKKNPQWAIHLALAPEVRNQLPAAVREFVEEWVSGGGAFSVLIADDFERGQSQTLREVTLGGKRYRAYVYGRRLDQISSANEPFRGIVLGDIMAVHEEPPANGGVRQTR